MKPLLVIATSRAAVVICLGLLLQIHRGAAQQVDITAEIETVVWPARDADGDIDRITSRTWTFRCLVGTNHWQMDGEFVRNARETWRFTGSNVIRQRLTTKPGSAGGKSLPDDAPVTETFDSMDGNPGRPSRSMDLLALASARIAWLAFCSSPCLKREGRQLFPPSGLWKELLAAPAGFADKTERFEDKLGLPRSVDLYTDFQQPVLQYRVARSTNLLGWEFPLEFHLAQYLPARSNAWALYLTARGRVTAIGMAKTLAASPQAAGQNHPRYIVNAGGPRNFVGISKEGLVSNQVRVAFKSWRREAPSGGSIAVFSLTNAESQSILLWNVRVQVPSKGGGTDGYGWDTIHDDYPAGSREIFPPGTSGEFVVEPPRETTWRVCILYSKEEAEADRPPGGRRRYFGNHEVITRVLGE